jgi:hypothetical protein
MLGGLSLLFAVVPSAAHHLPLIIQCVAYYPGPPDCCSMVSDSAGANVTYHWSVQHGYGYMDPTPTLTNTSHFNCDPGWTGTEQINNVADTLLGHGSANCYWCCN